MGERRPGASRARRRSCPRSTAGSTCRGRRPCSRGRPASIAISRSHAATHPDVRWAGIVHNGLDLARAPVPTHHNDELVFLGRIAPEKGILDAIEVARLTGRTLKVIAKRPVCPTRSSTSSRSSFPRSRPPARSSRTSGELSGQDRDRIVGASHAMLMPGTWPEPFGLAAIESLACGTPVLARRVGALPEIMRDGIDGFFGDDVEHLAFLVDRVDTLDRDAIRASVIERFSANAHDRWLRGALRARHRRGSRETPSSAHRCRSGPAGRSRRRRHCPAWTTRSRSRSVSPASGRRRSSRFRVGSYGRRARQARVIDRRRAAQEMNRVTAAIAARAPNSHR